MALLLASVGLFGLMSYDVNRRTVEIGVRMALSAQRNHVLRLVRGESMLLVSIGLALGLGIAVGPGRLVASLLFEITPTDPFTMGIAMTFMLSVATVAGYLPTCRPCLPARKKNYYSKIHLSKPAAGATPRLDAARSRGRRP